MTDFNFDHSADSLIDISDFEEKKNKHKQEIEFLNQAHPDWYRDQINALLAFEVVVPEQLEQQSRMLDDLNRKIIDELYIINSSTANQLYLNKPQFMLFTRFLMSPNYAVQLNTLELAHTQLTHLDLQFFPNLQKVGLCFNKSLASINFRGCHALDDILCGINTKLTILDNIRDCVLLKKVYITGSSLITLDLQGRVNLTFVHCESTCLAEVNLKDCLALEYLRLFETDLAVLDVSGLTNLKQVIMNQNKTLTTFNAQGCTHLKELEFLLTSSLIHFNIEGTPNALQEKYADLVAKTLLPLQSSTTSDSYTPSFTNSPNTTTKKEASDQNDEANKKLKAYSVSKP